MLTQPHLDQQEDEIKLAHRTVQTGDILIWPPGWLVGYTVTSEKMFGVRASFLNASQTSLEDLKTVQDLGNANIAPLVALLQVHLTA